MQDMFEFLLYFNKSHSIEVLVWSTRVSMLELSKSQKEWRRCSLHRVEKCWCIKVPVVHNNQCVGSLA
jgi:hypothetical protein